MSEKGTDSADVLQQIMGDTEKVIATIGARTETKLDLEQQIENMQKQFEEAEQLRDERQRQMRERVLTADLERLRAEAQTEQNDLAQAVFGLNAFLEKLGMEYAKIGELNAEEKALVSAAEAALAQARTARSEADQKWFFKQSAIEDAESAIEAAQANLKEAEQEARRMARQRLLSADMEQSLQEFQLRVHKTIDIMSQRMQEVEKQLKIVAARKAKAFEVKEQAARALEKLDRELTDKEAELRREEEILPTLENGTTRYAEQTTKVSNLRAQVEELRGRRNTAFVLFQSKEKFAAELEVHERTQQKLRDNQQMWITSLRSDTEERVVTFRSRLEAQKAVSDQDVARNLDDLGAEVDQRNIEFMAAAGAASDRLRMQKIEKHPKRLQDVAAVQAAQAEAVAEVRQREQKMIQHFKEKYGIDPTESSFFHYSDAPAGGGGSGGPTKGTF
jgi:hypothetical protein